MITENPMSATNTVAMIILAGGALISLSAFLEKVFGIEKFGTIIVTKCHNWFTKASQLEKLLLIMKAQNEETSAKVNEIQKQVQTNGGSSLKDAVVRLEIITAEIRLNQKVSDEKRKAEFDLNPSPVFISDPAGLITYTNPAWLKMVGCINADEVKGMGWLRAIPEQDRAAVMEEHDRTIAYPAPYSGKIRFKHLVTGDIINAICRTRLINPENKLIETIGTIEIL